MITFNFSKFEYNPNCQDILGLSLLRSKCESDNSKVVNVDMSLSCSDVHNMILIGRFSDLNILIM